MAYTLRDDSWEVTQWLRAALRYKLLPAGRYAVMRDPLFDTYQLRKAGQKEPIYNRTFDSFCELRMYVEQVGEVHKRLRKANG